METYACPHCGSRNQPTSKASWTKKDLIITAVLMLVFFPAGIIFVLFKLFSDKTPVCPDCGRVVEGAAAAGTVDMKKVAGVAKGIATDPEMRKTFRDVKDSFRDFQDTF